MISYDEILQDMKDEFYSLSGIDTDDASDIGIRLKTVAGQVFALYSKCEWLLREAFPQTASGRYLDMHASERAVTRKSATYASGQITFFRESEAVNDIFIPLGTICSTSGSDAKRFITTQDAYLTQGETSVTVGAIAENAGRAYNAAAGSISIMVTPPQGVYSAINENAFTGGADSEDDESLRSRLLDTYSCISNGTNAAFYREVALRHDGIGDANVIPRRRGRGTVDVVVSSSSNEAPSAEVIAEVTQMLEDAKEVGTDVSVYAASEYPIMLTVQITVKSGYDIDELISITYNSLCDFINSIGIGKTMYIRDVHTLLRSIEGIDNYVVRAPQFDVHLPDASKAITLGLSVGRVL